MYSDEYLSPYPLSNATQLVCVEYRRQRKKKRKLQTAVVSRKSDGEEAHGFEEGSLYLGNINILGQIILCCRSQPCAL